jgi:hypothetical protein
MNIDERESLRIPPNLAWYRPLLVQDLCFLQTHKTTINWSQETLDLVEAAAEVVPETSLESCDELRFVSLLSFVTSIEHQAQVAKLSRIILTDN